MTVNRTFKTLLLLLAICFTCTATAQTTFKAYLSGHNEVFPVASNGSGEITATLTGNTLVIGGTFDNLMGFFNPSVAGGAHIHSGYAGENGNIELSLIASPDIENKSGHFETILNTFTLTNAQLELLNERKLYVNIHTTLYKSGEIRGQLLPASDAYYTCNLFGNNEVPSVLSNGHGALQIEISGNQMILTGAFSDLDGQFDTSVGGGAHLHLALAGKNGTVEIPITATVEGSGKAGFFAASDNTFTLSADQMNAMLERRIYANIHTTAKAAGEIRGQVVPVVNAVFRAHLSGSNEPHVVMSRGSGQILAELKGTTLVVTGAFDNLESEINADAGGAVNLHIAPPGADGDIAVPLNVDFDADFKGGVLLASDNTVTLTTGQMEALLDRQCYINISTMDEAQGALRGQLMLESQAVFTAFLSGSQEMPDVNTGARGMVKAELSGSSLICTGSFADMSSALNVTIGGGAHLHNGLPGSNGSVEFALISDLNFNSEYDAFRASYNIFQLSAEQRADVMARAFYVNIHSLTHPTGELRGNFLAEANAYLLAPLSGASQPAGVNTEATGMVAVELNGANATAVGSFNNLESNFAANIAGGAHIHTAPAGSNGDISIFLNAATSGDLRSGTFAAADNEFQLSAGLLDTLRERMAYVNIHTENNTSGAIRGQCLPLANSYFHTTLSGITEVPAVTTQAQGGLKFELSDSTLACSGSFAMLEGAFDASVAGGSHLHIGRPGTTGNIAFTLNASISGDQKSGVYAAADNTFTLTAGQMDTFRNGDFYVNIHSTAAAAGELRGQILPDINLFPDTCNILLPLPGATIDIVGDASTLLEVTWTPSSDPDGDDLTYIWQLATDADFENIIFLKNVGNAQLLTATYGEIDVLLANSGTDVGGQVTLYHRIVASDGSNSSASPGNSAQFARSGVTRTTDPRGEEVAIEVYPNITAGTPITIDITSNSVAEANLLLVNELGQIVKSKPVQLPAGKQQFIFEMNTVSAGTYFMILKIGNTVFPAKGIVKR